MMFAKEVFWIQIHNLPLGGMNKMIGKKLGSIIDSLQMIDVDNNGIGWSKYLRVRLLLDLKKPLVRGLMVKIGGKSTWVTCKYERLPKFCLSCGVIQHGNFGCVNLLNLDFNNLNHPKQYSEMR